MEMTGKVSKSYQNNIYLTSINHTTLSDHLKKHQSTIPLDRYGIIHSIKNSSSLHTVCCDDHPR